MKILQLNMCVLNVFLRCDWENDSYKIVRNMLHLSTSYFNNNLWYLLTSFDMLSVYICCQSNDAVTCSCFYVNYAYTDSAHIVNEINDSKDGVLFLHLDFITTTHIHARIALVGKPVRRTSNIPEINSISSVRRSPEPLSNIRTTYFNTPQVVRYTCIMYMRIGAHQNRYRT